MNESILLIFLQWRILMVITAEITRLDAMTLSREITDSIKSSTIIRSLQIENVILDYIKRHKKIDLTGLNNKDPDDPESWRMEVPKSF